MLTRGWEEKNDKRERFLSTHVRTDKTFGPPKYRQMLDARKIRRTKVSVDLIKIQAAEQSNNRTIGLSTPRDSLVRSKSKT